MPDIRFFAANELPEHLLWQVRSFMRMHWTFLFDERTRLQTGLWWLESLAPVHVLLVENDVVLSYGAIVRGEVMHAGQQFSAYGLHGVFTFPDFRSEGYGGKLVKAATDYIQANQQSDLAILFCPPELVPFYSAAGWEWHQDAVTFIGPKDEPYQIENDAEKPDIRMMLFLSEKGQAAHDSFWDSPFYFGESGW